MDHDHIRRFSLSEKQPYKSFAMAAQDRPQVKTKDNAQPVIPPPRTTLIPHPKLAPPGMMGSRLEQASYSWKDREPPSPADQEKLKNRTYAVTKEGSFKATTHHEPFKAFVRDPNQSRGWER